MADRVGQRLGNYRLTHLLGKGGFAEVYLGEHVRLHTRAAVKVLYTRLGGSDEVESFQKEAQTIAHLDHPHIVRVLDFDVAHDTPFLVMGYATGGTLRQRLPKGMIVPLPTIVDYVKQVADALQYAHNQRVVHRDIKPENMLVGGRGELLLSDFGIAIIAQSSRYQGTQDMAGTVAYMAPEQVQGKPHPASDQYSLGVVVYEWLCGDRPFHGSFTEIATQHVLAPPPSLRNKVPTLSPAIEHVVMTALAKDPRQRFASVQAFASALEQVSRAGQPGPMTPAPLTTMLSQSQRPTLLASFPLDSWQQPVPANRLPQPYGMTPVPGRVEQTVPIMTPPNQRGEQADSFVTPRKSEPAQQGITRRTVVLGLGLAGLAVAGGGLAWFAASHGMVSPGATATPIPQPTPSPTSTPSGTLLFSDSFQNNTNGWDLTSMAGKFSVTIGGGAMVLEENDHHILWELLPGGRTYNNFQLTVDATLSKGDQNNGYGIYIRDSSQQAIDLATYYCFELYGDGTYAIFKGTVNASGTPQKSKLVDFTPHPAIQKGGTLNHLFIILMF